jgi:RNA polymerase sigma-70 factor (ECF subfamily)
LDNKLIYTEHELVTLLQREDNNAFAYLFEKYSKAIYNGIFQIVGEEENSNDVLQQVFVTYWQKIQLYDASKGRLFTWMLNIARNASIDLLRSKAHKNSRKNHDIENNVYSESIVSNNQLNIDTIGIKKFVDELKEDYRLVLTQSYYMGYTHEEIAENLQIPVGTVKTRLRASLIELRKKMIEH